VNDEESPAGDLEARRGRVLGASYRLFYDEPIQVVRGEDVYLWDADGRRYLDAYNNVASVGHSHGEVVSALAEQAAVLNTHTRYLGAEVVEYAEDLIVTFPGSLDRVVLTCTGSEANDVAYRLAKVVTGGNGVLVTSNAYHGVTDAVAQFSPSLGPAVAPGPHVRAVRAPDTYRESTDGIGQRFAADVATAIDDLRAHGLRPAAMFIDTVLSSDGVQTGKAGYLRPVQEVLQSAGVLLVADEVQAGFGRTGHMWGFERHGLEPDLVTLGKPMGNGHPIGGLVGRSELMDEFGRTARYFNTYGGNTVSAAVGRAVLRVIRRQGLVDNSAAVGTYLRSRLRDLQSRQPVIGQVRGEGLFVGLEIVDADGRADGDRAGHLVNGLRHRGVLVNTTGPHANVLKVRPPLTFSAAHADVLADALEEALLEDFKRS